MYPKKYCLLYFNNYIFIHIIFSCINLLPYSIDYNDSFLEIGAQFLHGQQDNPIYYIARDNKQIEEKYNEILDDDENIEDNNGIPIDLDNG